MLINSFHFDLFLMIDLLLYLVCLWIFKYEHRICFTSSSMCRISSSIFCRVSLEVMNSFSFCLFYLILKVSFVGYNNLNRQSFSFRVWNTWFQVFLNFRTHAEKSEIILIGSPLNVSWIFWSSLWKFILAVHISHFKYNVWWRGSFVILSIGVPSSPIFGYPSHSQDFKYILSLLPEEDLQAISFHLTIFFNSNDS